MQDLNKTQTKVIFSKAYEWLCRSRKNHPHNADVWDFRWKWDEIRGRVIEKFLAGNYLFEVQSRKLLRNGKLIDITIACDALVMKVVTIILENIIFPLISSRCYHVKGRGGQKGAVRGVFNHIGKYKYVIRTDVKSYYDSIDHQILIKKLLHFVSFPVIITYVWKYLNRTVEHNGRFFEVKRGLPMGSSLSPLLGALYLRELDEKLEKLGLFYLRYMDDILIMAETRWKLRKAIRILNEELEALGLCKHPDKTSIGKVEKGFDFLGYHFERNHLSVAVKTIDNFLTKALRLYEQGPVQSRIGRLGEYTKHWIRWTNAGLSNINLEIGCIWSV